MNKYKIIIEVVSSLEIEAENEQEAEDKLDEIMGDAEYDIVDITEI